MAYDNASRSVLLFGGVNGNSTWEWSGGDWTDLTGSLSAAPPVPHWPELMTFDTRDGYMLLWGCSGFNLVNGTLCNDTWEFSAGRWHFVVPRGALVPYNLDSEPYPAFSMTYDSAAGYVLLTDGVFSYSFAGGVWSRLAGNGPGLEGQVVYDAHDGYVLYVGWNASDTYTSGTYNWSFTGAWTWSFAGNTWTNISGTAGVAPSLVEGSMMTYDDTTGSVVLFGGNICVTRPYPEPECDVYSNATWTFQGGTWRNITASVGTPPPARSGGLIADDPSDSAIVLFGGSYTTATSVFDSTYVGLNDTWEWGVSPPIAGLSILVNPAVPVPGQSARLNSSFRAGEPPFTFSWMLGDGGTSALRNLSHTYAADGDYPVTLWVNDSSGHAARTTIQLQVYLPLAVALVNVSPDPAILGQPVSFSASASGGTPPYVYDWDFGDGGLGGDMPNITHIFTTDGPFYAFVNVRDQREAFAQAIVNISILLQALASSSITSGALPLIVHFTGGAEGGVPPYSFSWSFGDGAGSTLEDPTHTYNSSGTYFVTLTAVDRAAHTSVSTLQVHAGKTPSSGWAAILGSSKYLLLGAGAGILGALGATAFVIRRGQRREGQRWIREMTTDGPERVQDPRP